MKASVSLIVGIGMFIFVIAIILLGNSTTFLAKAQDSHNLRELLMELENRVEQGNGFTFSIVLANPPNPNFLEATIGTEDGFSISEIGTDFICVNRLAGAALTRGCIPFTNISTVAYLEN